MDEVPVRKSVSDTGSSIKMLKRGSSRFADSDMAHLLGRGVSIKRTMLDDGRDVYARTSIVEEHVYNAKKKANPVLELPEVKMYGETLLWADYYNNLLKCWEPLVEPMSFIVIHEKVRSCLSNYQIMATLFLFISDCVCRVENEALDLYYARRAWCTSTCHWL